MTTATKDKQDVSLNVEGMTCSNCALGISRYLEKQGMENVMVNFATGEARFKLDEPERLEAIRAGINKLGYKVQEENVESDEAAGKKKPFEFTLEKRFYFCLILTVPLLLHMVLPWEWLGNVYFQLALSTPVFMVGLWHFGRSAISSLKTGVPNMDVLIVMGSSAAFIYSLIGTIGQLGHDFMFYETAATIITLVLLGNVIEKRSVKQTTTAIQELTKLQVSKARIVRADESVEEVDARTVKPGDVLQINTGDKVAVDGEVIWGDCTANEAMVSGESLPVEKSVGDHLIGGSIIDKGSVKLKATSTAADNYLSRVIELVKSAQQNKPSIQRLADKVSAVFVPAVVLIALTTFALAFWAFSVPLQKALLNAVAVLAIACPCAMGLATPTAVMVGIGRVTKKGILIKGGSTIEELANIKQVVFDKTGTLTTGNFRIKDIQVKETDEKTVKSILYSIEKHSSHPIAISLAKTLKAAGEIELEKIEEMKGLGMKGTDKDGNVYEIGSFQMARKVTLDSTHDIYLLKNNDLIATVDIEDEIKEDAKETIQYLKSKGIRVLLMSGDSYNKCAHVANAVGIESFYGEKKPEEKLRLIEQLSREMPTAMVGDGINDAPALAKATVGISLSDATEVAIDSSRVILLNGKISALKDAFSLSSGTLTTIKQNLFWAFAYNIVAIPIAAFGFLNPMVAALSMAFSDVVVVGNSLRLKTRKIS